MNQVYKQLELMKTSIDEGVSVHKEHVDQLEDKVDYLDGQLVQHNNYINQLQNDIFQHEKGLMWYVINYMKKIPVCCYLKKITKI